MKKDNITLELPEQFKRNQKDLLQSWQNNSITYYDEVYLPADLSSEPIISPYEEKKANQIIYKEKKRLQAHHQHCRIFNERYCTACGKKLIRNNEVAGIWGKIRRCSECKEANRQATSVKKYCMTCGKNIADELLMSLDWRTKSSCQKCLEANKAKKI